MRPFIAALLANATLQYLCLFPPAIAKPGPQWNADPATSEWFRSLRNSHNESCCGDADGVKIEDPDWFETDGGDYMVFARGKWQTVPADRVIHPAGRKVGYAILWWPEWRAEPTCFLPGPRG